MKDKVLFENNEFFLLRDYPDKSKYIPDYDNREKWKRVLEACIAAKTRIENKELLTGLMKRYTDPEIKNGDIFDLPDNVEFEEICNADCPDINLGAQCCHPSSCIKVIHLKLKQEVKEESQEELFRHAIGVFNTDHKKFGRPDYQRLKEKFTIQRIHPEQ